MTINKTLSISIVAVVIITGFMMMTTSANAGFFDWLTGSQQEAQVSNAVESRTAASNTVSFDSYANVEAENVRAAAEEPTFWQRIFGIE